MKTTAKAWAVCLPSRKGTGDILDLISLSLTEAQHHLEQNWNPDYAEIVECTVTYSLPLKKSV